MSDIESDGAQTPAEQTGQRRGRGRPKKLLTDESDAESDGAEESPVQKRGRGRPKKITSDDSDEESDEAESPAEQTGRKRGRGRPKKPKSDEPEEYKPKRPRGRPLGSKKKPEEPRPYLERRGRPRKAIKGSYREASISSDEEEEETRDFQEAVLLKAGDIIPSDKED